MTDQTDSSDWNKCDYHIWEEIESQYSNSYYTDVRCKKCGCPGELDNEDGTVFWPAT